MGKLDIDKISTSESLRLYVLEFTLYTEELISRTIGGILDIEWENSKSFGFSSSSLSFNQKITLVQDLKGITPLEVKKFTCLMNIRNKFAHVKAIDSYKAFYEYSNNGKEIKKNLENWYQTQLPNDKNLKEDDIFKIYLKLLSKDLIYKLNEIILKTGFEKLTKATKEHLDLIKYYELKHALLDQPNGKDILRKLEKKTGHKF